MVFITFQDLSKLPSSIKIISKFKFVFSRLFIIELYNNSKDSSDNSILVDPTKEKQSLFVIARVMIQNTGNQPLTNITIDYGDGDKDFISILKPGKTMILSPPDGNSLQFVRVTADGNVDVYKAYREPIAMPGMMGS